MSLSTHIIKHLQRINSENVGPITFYKLLKHYGNIDNALEALPSLPKYKLCPLSWAEREYEKAQHNNIDIISFQDAKYPQAFHTLNDAPPIIYLKGNSKLLNTPASIAVVGARNASINGRKTASRISYDLTNSGVLVVSGMARGIDSAAHKGAMYARSQRGATLAVLGNTGTLQRHSLPIASQRTV